MFQLVTIGTSPSECRFMSRIWVGGEEVSMFQASLVMVTWHIAGSSNFGLWFVLFNFNYCNKYYKITSRHSIKYQDEHICDNLHMMRYIYVNLCNVCIFMRHLDGILIFEQWWSLSIDRKNRFNFSSSTICWQTTKCLQLD